MSVFSEYFATVSPDGKRVTLLAYAYPPHELGQFQVSLSKQEYDFLYTIVSLDKHGLLLEQILTDDNYQYQLLESIRYKIGKVIHATGKYPKPICRG